jgi:hypothetical protein
MRGNAARVLFCVWLVFSGPSQLAAQPIINMQGMVQFVGQIPATPPANPPGFVPPTGDLLEFVDGSLMHGELKRMDTASGLRWENPAAKTPIDLQPAHIDSIRFAHANSVGLAPTSHLRFANGDDLFGSVTSLDDDHLVFSTWFGGPLTIQRASLQTVTMLSSNYTILYEGPGETNGWIIDNHNPESWTLLDGTFSSGAPGTLSRDFKLSGSSTIEFDLAWSDIFGLLVFIYSDAADHLDAGSSYELEFTRDQVSFRRADSSRQFPFRTFGSVPLPKPAGKSKVHITIQSNKEEGTVAVYSDNILAKRWKDEGGFSATGGGVLFAQTGMAGATIKLSNFKISQWQGRYEPEASAVATNVDVVRFINHDQAAGKITAINGGKVTLAMADTLLQIPLQRVTQINFAAAPVPAAARGPWEVRAHFPRGGNLSFQLEKWDDKEVSGRSAIFGSLAFQPGQIRQLEFNLDHPKAVVPAVSDREFEGLDE